MLSITGSSVRACCFKLGKELLGIGPANRLHERVDVGRSFRTIVDVIGMLVHVEGQDGYSARERVRVVGGPLINQLTVPWRPGQEHPSRSARKGLSHRDELRAPTLEGAKISRERCPESRPGLALIPKTIEKELMQDH